jgi:hypothetical protein
MKQPVPFQTATIVLGGCLVFAPAPRAAAQRICTSTAEAAFNACGFEIRDDRWIAEGKCQNLANEKEREGCIGTARAEFEEGKEECEEQLEAREDACELLGERRYDPNFVPANFVDPAAIGRTVAPNPFFPLRVGTRWVYREGRETVTVTVTDKTKLIDGVNCRVVTDVVEVNGVPTEVTDDWFAQDVQGNVWYCGEVSREFETFSGDAPAEPELVELEGSWKAGRDFDQPGIIMLGAPSVGSVYREEVSLGNAEDMAEVISLSGSESVPAASCGGRCVVTRNFTPLEPGGEEEKYYAPDVGLILEVQIDEDEGATSRVELISFTRGS